MNFVTLVAAREDAFISSINLELRGGHYHVTVFVEHHCAGTLIIDASQLEKMKAAFGVIFKPGARDL